MEYPKIIKSNYVTPKFTDNNFNNVSKSANATYRLSLILNSKFNVKDDIVVLMMNPSDADKDVSDQTTNKLISVINNNAMYFNKLITINVFPMIKKASSKLLLNDFKHGDFRHNTQEIIKIFNNKNFNIKKVIIATGDMNINNKSIHHKLMNRYKLIIQHLKNQYDLYKIGDLNSKNFTRHPSKINLGEKIKPAAFSNKHKSLIK